MDTVSTMLTAGGAVAQIGLVGLAMPVVVLVLKAILWMRRQRHWPSEQDPASIEATSGYRRCVAAAAVASGSQQSWDHTIRPVLADLVEAVIAERDPLGPDPHHTGRYLLGEELWSLVDRTVPRSHDRSRTGPGAPALARIIELLELAHEQAPSGAAPGAVNG
jgi:hypothetical protein